MNRVRFITSDVNIVIISTISVIGGIGADSVPAVFAANLPSRGLYRSTNAMSAAPIFTQITVQPANGGDRGISDLAFDPADPNVLLEAVAGFTNGGKSDGLLRSANPLVSVLSITSPHGV